MGDWVASYLQNRQQIVDIYSTKSQPALVPMGVPQGSTLAPLLFIIFASDITYSCKTPQKMIIYADDTSQIVAEHKLSLSVEAANFAAKEFADWCSDNGLLVNTNKTVFMIFQQKNISYDFCPLIKLNHRSIEQVAQFKYLGVTMDQKLTWEVHTDKIVSRMSALCFVFRQLYKTASLQILKLAYFGLVQSVITYGLPFWGNSVHMMKVFIMQKKVLRCLTGSYHRASCRDIFRSLSLLTLPCLYIYIITLHIKKNESRYLKNNMVHEHHTRRGNELRLPFSQLAIGQDSADYRGIICYNHAIRLLGNGNYAAFKSNLFKYLSMNVFYSVQEFLDSRF